MGILHFLSKKSTTEPQLNATFKAQAYELTTASEAPIRGTRPVAGNGNVFETLKKAHAKQSQTSLSSHMHTINRLPTSDSKPPKTAGYDEETETKTDSGADSVKTVQQRIEPAVNSRNGFRRPPPLKRVPRRVENSLLTPSPKLSPGQSPGLELPRSPFLYQGSGPRTVSLTSTSARSDAGKGFVDLLDAQSGIVPLNFHARVQAAGVRDYGEDVADRNLGTSRLDSQSSVAKGSNSSVPMGGLYGGNEKPSSSRASRFNNGHESPPRWTQQGETGRSALRTRSLNSSVSSPPVLHNTAIPPVPSLDRTSLTRPGTDLRHLPAATRRRLVNGHNSKSQSGSLDIAPSLRTKQSSTTNPNHAFHHLSISKETITQSDDSPVKLRISPVERSNSASKLIHRDSVTLSKKRDMKKRAAADVQVDDEDLSSDQSHSTEKPPSFGQRSHRGSLSSSTASRQRSKSASHHRFGPFGFSSYPGLDIDSAYPRLPSLKSRPRTAHGLTAHGHDRLGSSSGVSTAGRSISTVPGLAQPSRSSHSRGSSRDLSSCNGDKGRLDEIVEHVPARTSSLSHWSMISSTPTTSDASSNAFNRPQSRHTTNTSVDLGVSLPPFKTSRHNSVTSHPTNGHARTASGTQVHSRNPSNPASVHVDDYLSSGDGEDYATPRRSREEGEESLLFRDDGYGFAGALPGLVDFSEPTIPLSSITSHSPRISTLLPVSDPYQAYTSPFSPPPLPRKYILDTAADYDSMDGGDDIIPPPPGRLYYADEWEGDPYSIPLSRGHGARQMAALSRMNDDQRPGTVSVSVSNAVRLRKEARAKSRRRASSASRGRSKRHGNSVALTVEDGDEGNAADVE